MPICNGLGDIGRFSITGSDVMPISPLGGRQISNPTSYSESPLATSY